MGSQEVSNVDWQGKHVTVAGLGVSGIPAARALRERGALVTVVNDGDDERSRTQAAGLLFAYVPIPASRADFQARTPRVNRT